MNQLNNSAEKHQLFSEDLMKKFNDLQQLIEEIFTPEMLKNMDWLSEALTKLDTKEILRALDELSNNLGEVENELDRYLDIFKRHDLTKLAAAKPGLLEPRVNNGTKNVFDSIEEDSRNIEDLDDGLHLQHDSK